MDPDRHEDVDPHPSRVMRAVLVLVGVVSVVLGVVGLFLPVVPTTPFLLLSAACFARSSPSLYRRLAESKTFGPSIREWRRHRSIAWRTKLTAIGLMSLSIASSIVFFVEPIWGKVVLALVGVSVGIWLYRIPSRDRPR